MKKVMIRGQYDEPLNPTINCDFDPLTGEELPEELKRLTKQANKEECDINNIMRRYEQGGQLPEMIAKDPRYGDFSSVPSFQQAFEIVKRAEEQFAALDARVRDRFDNNPERMLAFCSDPKNAEEMVKLGLALPRKPQAPQGAPQPPAGGSAPATTPQEPPKTA